MKKTRMVWAGIAFVLAITFSLPGQVAVTAIPTGTVSLSATDIWTMGTPSNTQLEEFLNVLEATPTIAAEDLPRGGMVGSFFSLAHPNWPPLPENIRRVPVWKLNSDSGLDVYLLDDLDFPESSAAGGMMAMDDLYPPGFEDGGTNGGGGCNSNFQLQVFTTNDLWLQLVGTTNTGTGLTANLVIHAPWKATDGIYDLYFKTNLAISNNWTCLLQNVVGQTNLVATNLPPKLGFFRLKDTAIRPGFTNNILANPANDTGHGSDDGSTDSVTIGFALNFFGTSYSHLFVNNNGNVTFDNNLGEYTPTNLVNLGKNIIAPFWADVDTRSLGSGVVTYGSGTVDGQAAFVVNWVNVGYFAEEDDKLNSFQLALINRSDRTNGDYDVEFNYAKIQWEAGEASGGEDGLWTGWDFWYVIYDGFGRSARAGYASVGGSTFELNGSAVPGALLDTNLTTGLIYHNFNSTVPGRYVFQFHNGVPLATP